MKKFLSLFVAAGIFSLVACGPAAEETTAEDTQAQTEELMDQLEATEVESTEEVAEEGTEGEVKTEQAN
jgi:protein involved in sex pheromone biosynthesis